MNPRRAFAIFLFFLSFVFTLYMLKELLSNFSTSIGPSLAYQSGVTEVKSMGLGYGLNAQSTLKSGWKGGSHATLTLIINRFVPSEGHLEGVISLYVPDDIKYSLWDESRRIAIAPVGEGAGSSNANLLPEHKEMAIIVHFQNRMGLQSAILPISLDDLFRTDQFREVRVEKETVEVPVVLPLVQSPLAYPSDWYWSTNFVDVRLPSPLTLHAKDHSGILFYIPTELKVASTVGMADKEVILAQFDDQKSTSTLEVLVTRDAGTKGFVYLITLVPLVFLILLVHLVFFSPSAKNDGDASHDFVLEMIAAMLAVLPLRQVVVPADMQGLTRVDLILGLELVLIASLAFVRYGLSIWKQPRMPRQRSSV